MRPRFDYCGVPPNISIKDLIIFLDAFTVKTLYQKTRSLSTIRFHYILFVCFNATWSTGVNQGVNQGRVDGGYVERD